MIILACPTTYQVDFIAQYESVKIRLKCRPYEMYLSPVLP